MPESRDFQAILAIDIYQPRHLGLLLVGRQQLVSHLRGGFTFDTRLGPILVLFCRLCGSPRHLCSRPRHFIRKDGGTTCHVFNFI